MQPSKYRCTQLQYRFAVISEAPSGNFWDTQYMYTPALSNSTKLKIKIKFGYQVSMKSSSIAGPDSTLSAGATI